VDCKKLVSEAFRNHAIFAKLICKGSDCKWCRGGVGSLTRVDSMNIGYFSLPGERVLLWFWHWSWDCFLVAHMCFKGAIAVKSIFVD